jgi:hypothetical protein
VGGAEGVVRGVVERERREALAGRVARFREAGARKPFEIVPRRATVLMGVNFTPIFGEKLPPKSE